MPADEISGVVEIGQWCPHPAGVEVLLEPTSKVRRFRVKIRPKEKRASTVRHRRLGARLTDNLKGGI